MRKAARILSLTLTAALLLAGCNASPKPVISGTSGQGAGQTVKLEKYEAQYFDYFDTVSIFTAYAPDQETFDRYKEIFSQEMLEYHELFDIYKDYEGITNIKTINDQAGISPVKVDQRILDLLKEAQEMEEVTGGAMNVAMGSVLSIWHTYRTEGMEDPEHAKLPETASLQEAAKHMDITQMELDEENKTVYLADPEMSLDVGSIAKGFATEQVARDLEEAGLEHAMLNIGGNIRTIGAKPDGSSWKLGIQNPDTSSSTQYLHVVELQGGALVTSGVYQRYYTVNGVNYHHIIQPERLAPWNRYASVTILCEDSGLADCLSTAVFNMEPDQGKELIESMPGVEALWILPDQSELYSSGFQARMSG